MDEQTVTSDMAWSLEEINAYLDLLERLNVRVVPCRHGWTIALAVGHACAECQAVQQEREA